METAVRRLVIDIGTNSVLALLVEISKGSLNIIFDVKKTTRFGEGLIGSGLLSDSSMERTAGAIETFIFKDHYDSAMLLGTEALRVASNAHEFSKLVFERTGEKIIILSGEKEAELNYIGALYRLPLIAREILVIDVGGGSTEFAIGNSASMACAVSVPLGASRLYESVSSHLLDEYTAQSEKIIVDCLGEIHPEKADIIIGTGGTITSLAAMESGQTKYEAASIHGRTLNVKAIRVLASRFEGLDSDGRRKLIEFDPQRAELILPGAGIFLAILGILQKDRLVVSTGGLRFGAALRPDAAHG